MKKGFKLTKKVLIVKFASKLLKMVRKLEQIGIGSKLGVGILLIGLLVGCYSGDDPNNTSNPVVGGTADKGDHLTMGNPSGATPNIVNADNYLMIKDQYVLSYNNSKHTANWVSWHLSSAWLGTTSRQDDFRTDYTLPTTWYAVNNYDFSGSGFDRGHLCPSADRTKSISDNSATFFMTNMIPQAPENNQKPWADFESYCRSLISKGFELYIIAGPNGVGGIGNNGYSETIGNYKIVVPKYTWKVVVALFNGDNDISRVNENTRVIAIWMPNEQTASSKAWYQYRVSVDYVEQQTGFDFFSNIPTTIQNAIESRVDNTSI